MMTIAIEIPALDRLCSILEERDRAGLVAQLQNEIVEKLHAAAENGTLKAAVEPEPQTAPEPRKPAQEPPKPSPANVSTAPAAPAPAPAAAATAAPEVTLEDVQRAAARMRDEGKLKAVTDMFAEFEIKKLSDLKGDKLQAFAGRLRGMGAKL